MFVTTSGRTNQHLIETAIGVAETLEIPYVPRRKKSISLLQNEKDSHCIVVGKDRLELHETGSTEPFFFHPNSAMFRIKRLINGEHDPFAEAADLSKGMTLLDCTLGLASDAAVASYLVGDDGQVVGAEGNKYLAYLVSEGLQSWDSGVEAINAAMRRIKVIHTKAIDYLTGLPDKSFDCVYFDPMFEESIEGSVGLQPLARLALHDDLSPEVILHAKRVAKKRVILKDHYRSERFHQYGFEVIQRKSAKFHYGIIKK
ncbi:class I SAM-dependent methyltransferase [Neobacillus sp. LXY-1]|uniref:class I SAM-dependent methyltransferase n=1 Tax=Neobacillus sp. LXY-1 TaxID=3379133 RepID=UPI003EDED421